MNEKYYPDPFKFDPNRFLNNDGSLKERIKFYNPYSIGVLDEEVTVMLVTSLYW